MSFLSHALDPFVEASDVLNGFFALLAALFAGLLAVLRWFPGAQARLVTSHLGTPALFGKARAAAEGLTSAQRGEFRKCVAEIAGGADTSAAEGVHRTFPGMQSGNPWSDSGPTQLLEWCEFVSKPGRESFLGRLVAPDQLVFVRSFIARVIDYLHQFATLNPATPQDDSKATMAYASYLSGAAVLVDAADSRSGVASYVLVRHAPTFRGNGRSQDPDGRGGTYADAHPARNPQRDEMARLGDYDGRLPDVVGVGVAASTINGAVAFVLDTAETCYRASEDAERRGCKKLATQLDDSLLPRFTMQPNGWSGRNHRQQRVSILTSYVSLLARGDHEDPTVLGLREASGDFDVLVLCRRSAVTQNGQGTLSAAAGGLVELGADLSMDVTAAGSPTPVAAAARECMEELGWSLSPNALDPVAVFMCTVQGRRPSEPTAGVRRYGQLVTVVLSLAPVSATLANLRSAQRVADHAIGGFEVDRLEGIAMYGDVEGCDEFAHVAASLSRHLDQHGLLSCFYAAVRRWGPMSALASFERAFSKPWWRRPWSGEDDGIRVCRDPQQIRPLPADAPAYAWDELVDRIQAEAAEHP